MILGVAEIGLVMNDYLALADSVRAGARTASTSGPDIYSDWAVLTSIENETAALQKSKIKRIVIYKPATFGEAPTAACQNGIATEDVCNVYTYEDLKRSQSQFGCLAGYNLDRYWCPSDRKISLSGTGTDYVGVWMKVEHPWLTKMFGATKTLTDSSVIRLEPRTKS